MQVPSSRRRRKVPDQERHGSPGDGVEWTSTDRFWKEPSWVRADSGASRPVRSPPGPRHMVPRKGSGSTSGIYSRTRTRARRRSTAGTGAVSPPVWDARLSDGCRGETTLGGKVRASVTSSTTTLVDSPFLFCRSTLSW